MLITIAQRIELYNRKKITAHLPQAGVLIAITDELEPHVILTKRAKKLSSHSGEIALPGGRRDDSDPSVVFTALREAHEEINLLPEQVKVLGKIDDQISLHNIKVTPSVGIIANDIEFTANQGELDCVFKVPLSFLLEAANQCGHLAQYRYQSKFAPCYLYEGHLIWGLTSYILAEFLNVTLDADIKLKTRQEVVR
ncbi:CoA pyrophosphatase [Gammaproteobacteria bacterium AS21]